MSDVAIIPQREARNGPFGGLIFLGKDGILYSEKGKSL